jgi:hypothetical protein
VVLSMMLVKYNQPVKKNVWPHASQICTKEISV